MLISANNLKNVLTNKLCTSPAGLDLCQLANANTYASVAYSVPSSTCLPPASCNTGKFAYVQDECTIKFSNGNIWSTDFIDTFHGTDTLKGYVGGAYGLNQFYCFKNFDPEVSNILSVLPINCLNFAQTFCFENYYRLKGSQQVSNWTDYSLGTCSLHFIDGEGILWGWGGNGNFDLGDGTSIGRFSSPVQITSKTWCKVTSSNYYGLAIDTAGCLWGWGYNNAGQLGQCNTSGCYSVPVCVCAGITNWCQISLGPSSQSAGITNGGILYTWGSNGSGELGSGDTISRCWPQQTQVGGSNWCKISIGANFSAAVKTDGTLWTWGSSSRGQLGNGTTICCFVPTQTCAGGTDWCDVVASSQGTAAIKTNGQLWSWGCWHAGLRSANISSPETAPNSLGLTWQSLTHAHAYGSSKVYGITTTGSLYSWGNSGSGPGATGAEVTCENILTPRLIGSPYQSWKCVRSQGDMFIGIGTDITGI